MSSVASSSGNMPPRHGKKLADVMDDAFKSNSNHEDGDEEKTDGGVQVDEPPPEESEQPIIKQIQGYTISSVYPPQPCERCIRSKKTCKGIAGARCEQCKALHQKCSNNTGPPRGKHVAVENGKARNSSAPPRPKRKAAAVKSKLYEIGDDEDEIDDDEESKLQPVRKKPRTNHDSRARMLKDLGDLEGAIKKIQATFASDFTKLQKVAVSLALQIREMDT